MDLCVLALFPGARKTEGSTWYTLLARAQEVHNTFVKIYRDM